MSTTPALLIAAGGVGFGHAVLPDHWVPLAVLGRTRRYRLRKVARLSGLAGVAHVLVSLVLGGVIVVIGLQFRGALESAQQEIVGALLVGTGIAFLAAEAMGRGPGHAHPHEHEHAHAYPHPDAHDGPHPHRGSRFASLAGVMVPFGAAASPDLTILPVFLAAAAVGAGTAIGSLAVFAAVTIGTIVVLTVSAAAAGYRVRGRWLDRGGNTVTALVLIVIGALVLAGVL